MEQLEGNEGMTIAANEKCPSWRTRDAEDPGSRLALLRGDRTISSLFNRKKESILTHRHLTFCKGRSRRKNVSHTTKLNVKHNVDSIG